MRERTPYTCQVKRRCANCGVYVMNIEFKFQNFGARNSKFLHVAVGAEPERENVRLSRHQDSGQGDGWQHQRQKLPREDSQRQRKSWKAENR